jgi:two-component system sensor histidine kinase/response regulator
VVERADGNEQGAQRPARILLVDDDVDVLRVLTTAIRSAGYECVAWSNGEDALEHGDEHGFDAAVLDVHLPGIDGIELGQRLKAAVPEGELFPVMLIGGSDIVEERVRGFAAGCDDFLGKPLSLFEVVARLRVLLARRATHQELATANRRLRELQDKRRELATLVVHDLRNPLSALLGNIELLGMELGAAAGKGSEAASILADLDSLAHKALGMVATILDVEELEEGLLEAEPREVDVGKHLAEVARPYAGIAQSRKLRLDVVVPDGERAVFDAGLIGRMLENLLDNATRYARYRGRVELRAERVDDALELRIGNDGPPVADEQRAHIFDRFYRIEARRAGARENRGLGLYFCKLAVEVHGGTIAVDRTVEFGTQFVVRLPQPS